MSDRPRFIRMTIAGTRVPCTGLQVDPLEDDGVYHLTIHGTGFPEHLRQTVRMGSELSVVSRTSTHENIDTFIMQDTPGGSIESDGTFVLTVKAVLIRRSPRHLDDPTGA